jgi:hypothetical protein
MTKHYNGFQMPRLDRLATLGVCHPLARLLSRGPGRRVPILMYHSISDNLFAKSHPYYQINTSPGVFAWQMRWLRRNGYRTLNLGEMLAALNANEDLSRTVVITFMTAIRTSTGRPGRDEAADSRPRFSVPIAFRTSRSVSRARLLTGGKSGLHAEGIQFGSHTVAPGPAPLAPNRSTTNSATRSDRAKTGRAGDVLLYPFAFRKRIWTSHSTCCTLSPTMRPRAASPLSSAAPSQAPILSVCRGSRSTPGTTPRF